MIDEALTTLQELGLTEPTYRMRFHACRDSDGRGVQDVTIEVSVSGVNEKRRYRATASTDDGRTASGNAESNLRLALAGVHWYELD